MSSRVTGTLLLLMTLAACAPTESREQTGADTPSQVATRIDWAAVDEAMGREGSLQSGTVYRFGMPRTDLSVTSAGVPIRPSFALGSWLAMIPAGTTDVIAMGDLVVTQEELAPLLSTLQENGIGQSALHKHLPEHTPDLWWAHIHAHGDPVEIAVAVRAALEETATPEARNGAEPPALTLDTAAIRRALGHGGRDNSGVYSVTVPRAETITAMGVELPPEMGTATAINFQPTGPGTAAISGDFVMIADEIDGVATTLMQHDIEVVSLHNHLTDEEPRLFFLHFWANGDPVRLAEGLGAALDRTNSLEPERVWAFEDQPTGEVPPRWSIEQTNPRGDGAVWEVVQEGNAPSGTQVLALLDPRGATGSTFNLAWTAEHRFQDGRIEVEVRAREGDEDRGGGPVWRVQDANNYYVARWNPLEDNVRLYVVVDGSRRQIASAGIEASAADWHSIVIEHHADRIIGYFDGAEVWDAVDDTFAGPGGVGVWTKADAASGFDDLLVRGTAGSR